MVGAVDGVELGRGDIVGGRVFTGEGLGVCGEFIFFG